MRTYEQPMDWLLEKTDPGVRYLALRDLLGAHGDELSSAATRAHKEGPIAEVLAKMEAEGYWVQRGPGYNPKYRALVWSITLLAQLGASAAEDERIGTACSSLLEHALTKDGQFSIDGRPSGTIDCLQGNLCTALLDFGYDDPRLDKAFEWMARSLTGEGVAPVPEKKAPPQSRPVRANAGLFKTAPVDDKSALRYYAGKCGPSFACGANNKLPCAWGGVKVMLAFSKLRKENRTPLIDRAIKAGVDFLFSKDPADCDYPSGWAAKPSGNWWKFGFPVFYVTDLLQNAEALAGLGYARDPRLARALNIVREKRDSSGCWALEYDYTGKTWVDFGPKKRPNKWVTLRALKVLRAAGDFK
jgi:hypothetical protein